MSRNAILLFGLAGFVLVGLVALALSYRPPMQRIVHPNPRSFSPADVRRGADLAAIGDCRVCHTADYHAPYAGGRPLPTPFGTIYSTNITPDDATGIGNWSRAAFRRAMRDGVAQDGSHLYPALPYENFTRVNDEDLDAIYAFLMTRTAVSAPRPSNKLIFPLGFRPLLAGWKLLFLHTGPFIPTPGRSNEWNRGAELAEGLGHCGACHTPRNLAGAEEGGHAYSGGIAEAWNAPALDASNPMASSWGTAALYSYLRTGMDSGHSAAAGPMGPVARHLTLVPKTDVLDIAVYIASLMQANTPARAEASFDHQLEAAHRHPLGAALFAGACAGCHETGAPMMRQGRPPLSRVTAIQEDDPRNTLEIILQGMQPPVDASGPYMPSFIDSLSNGDLVELAGYLRTRYSSRPTWSTLERTVARARKDASL
jgi:mono/diheme cytochrome c family protein